jgi:hypothetical protein
MDNEITIQIGENKHSFHFGMGAWEKFCELQHCEFDDMLLTGIFPVPASEYQKEIKFNPFVFKNIMFAAYLHQCDRLEIEPALNKATASDIIEVIFQDGDLFKEISNIIVNSIKINSAGKKKVQKAKS